MRKNKKKNEYITLKNSLPSDGHPMAAFPGIGHVRPDINDAKAFKVKTENKKNT